MAFGTPLGLFSVDLMLGHLSKPQGSVFQLVVAEMHCRRCSLGW